MCVLVLLVQVRMAALNSLVVLCELLPHDARMAHLLPLVRRHMQPLELELPLQRTLAAAFPRLLAAVRAVCSPATSKVALAVVQWNLTVRQQLGSGSVYFVR